MTDNSFPTGRPDSLDIRSFVIRGAPLEEMPDDLRVRAEALLPKGATLIGVSSHGIRYRRGEHEYDRPFDPAKPEVQALPTTLIIDRGL